MYVCNCFFWEKEMEYILTGQEMAEADRRTSEIIGIPSIVLMERAALAVAQEILRRLGRGRLDTSAGSVEGGREKAHLERICILAGPGNNGADGLAVGRLLMDRGYPVQILLLSDRLPAEGSSPWIQRKILESYPECYEGAPQLYTAERMESFAPEVIVDALFGTGLARPLAGRAAEIVGAVNAWRERTTQTTALRNCLVVGLDMPSGVSSEDGRILGCAPQCDMTVTFAFHKRGHLLFPGAKLCGEVILRQIGITDRAFWSPPLTPGMYRLSAEDVISRLGARDESGNKGTFGKVLLIAGSKGMCGAALMGAEACMRSGAGMVKLFTREENRVIVQERLPEAMLTTYDASDAGMDRKDKLLSDLRWADVAAIGSGIGRSAEAEELVKILLESVQPTEQGENGTGLRGMVFDADALRILAMREDLRGLLASRDRNVPCILTPHLAEFADLLHISVAEAASDRETKVHALAGELHCTVIGKDARTMVASEEGGTCLITNGNSGMATAGSGDVLTGITASILAQCGGNSYAGKSVTVSQHAAETAAWIHAQTGEVARRTRGERAMIAGDLISGLSQVMREIEEREESMYADREYKE